MLTEGTIIHGTLRTQDLIPCFMSELIEHDAEAYKILHSRIDSYAWDEDDNDFWYSEDASYILECRGIGH